MYPANYPHEPAPEHDDTFSDFTSQISEKLKLARPCASGSFGDVYRLAIKNSKGTTEVAVKVFKIVPGGAMEKTENAMRRELIVWLRLKHPTIVPLLGTAKVESPFLALVSQWMPSGTLYMYLEPGTITDSAKVKLAKGVADGLIYLHSNKVVHGDLHPANVLIDGSGNPRLTDFGLATVAGDAELQLSKTTVTRDLDPRWRAPEIIGINPETDPVRPNFKSDMYSFGGVMFFIVSGDIPWKEKKKPYLIILELLKGAIPARPNYLLDDHWNLIKKCWSSDPADRPQATEVITYIAVKITTIFRKTEMVESTIWTTAPKPAWIGADNHLTTSSTDSESPCIVSPSGSHSSFGFVEREDPCCERDLPSSLTQPCLKMGVDLKKYRDEPENLTRYITRTQNHPHSCGGFVNVWKCKLGSFPRSGKKMPPRNVAVKAFRGSSRNSEDMDRLIKKLRQEVFVWQQLEHSHILPLYGTADEFDIVPALVCPWMENGPLDQYLAKMRREQLPPKMHRLFLLLFQVVLGLQYLHSINIIHGDLMPSNVLIDENENALLADFGLSRLLADHEMSFFASHNSGATRWAAPEIISLEPNELVSKPNKASDIYSFGCVMMQVLSGHPPYFDMKVESLVVLAKSKGIPPTRPELPAIDNDYWCYIQRCWSTHVVERPSVDQVLDYIKAEHDRQKLFS